MLVVHISIPLKYINANLWWVVLFPLLALKQSASHNQAILYEDYENVLHLCSVSGTTKWSREAHRKMALSFQRHSLCLLHIMQRA